MLLRYVQQPRHVASALAAVRRMPRVGELLLEDDGLASLGLDADALIKHGMPRIVYVAELCPGGPSALARGGPAWTDAGPSQDDVAGQWRARWVAPRLESGRLDLDELRGAAPRESLLSRRLP